MSRFSEDQCLPQESFRLVRRDGHKLGNNGGELMVNFMRCDKPQLVMRVVAFDVETNHSYSFDLMYEDLFMLVEGNTKLFDPDQKHSDDLCLIILNNLTLIRRPIAQSTKDKLGGGVSEGEDDDDYDGHNVSGFVDDSRNNENDVTHNSSSFTHSKKNKGDKGPNMEA